MSVSINDYKTTLTAAMKLAGLKYDETIMSRLLDYTERLLTWNEVMNLTALTSPEDVAIRHFLDSWMLLPIIDEMFKKNAGQSKSVSLIDVGTGAGFPGLPLKLVREDIKLVLLDALMKRVRFLQEVADNSKLAEISCIHGRAEETARNKLHREKYDIATARAVASLPELCEYCLPFVKIGGVFVAMKGDVQEELKHSTRAIKILGGTLEDVREFILPGTDYHRTIVVIRKISKTPPTYPRKAGKPHSSPIS
jgi:16S rRNA (guanine527-N7)-methyltransferase